MFPSTSTKQINQGSSVLLSDVDVMGDCVKLEVEVAKNHEAQIPAWSSSG